MTAYLLLVDINCWQLLQRLWEMSTLAPCSSISLVTKVCVLELVLLDSSCDDWYVIGWFTVCFKREFVDWKCWSTTKLSWTPSLSRSFAKESTISLVKREGLAVIGLLIISLTRMSGDSAAVVKDSQLRGVVEEDLPLPLDIQLSGSQSVFIDMDSRVFVLFTLFLVLPSVNAYQHMCRVID